MSTWSPSAISPISVSATVALTMYESVPMTTIWPVDEPEPVLLDAALLAALDAALLFPAPPEPDPVPATCWPVVRSTEATVPEMVEVKDAPFRLVCAVDKEDSADVPDASSESIELVEAPDASSLPRRSSAAVSCAWAAVTSSDRAVVSTVASTCPAVTVCPALTFTPVTVPETAKFRLAWLAGWSVPELATVCWMVPVVALTVAVVTVNPVAGVELEVSQSVRPTAPPIRTTTRPTMGQRYRRQTDDGPAARTFSSSSGNSSVRSTEFSGASTASVFAMRPVQTGDVTVSRISAVSPLGVLPKSNLNSLVRALQPLSGTLRVRSARTEPAPKRVRQAEDQPAVRWSAPASHPPQPGRAAAT